MGKVVGIGILVLGIWMAAEYVNGTPRFSDAHAIAEGEPRPSIGSRVDAKVTGAYAEGSARLESMLASE